jgi:hypothetical protein
MGCESTRCGSFDGFKPRNPGGAYSLLRDRLHPKHDVRLQQFYGLETFSVDDVDSGVGHEIAHRVAEFIFRTFPPRTPRGERLCEHLSNGTQAAPCQSDALSSPTAGILIADHESAASLSAACDQNHWLRMARWIQNLSSVVFRLCVPAAQAGRRTSLPIKLVLSGCRRAHDHIVPPGDGDFGFV